LSIYKRASGRYAVLVDRESAANMPRVRKSLGTFATKKEAEKAERDGLLAIERGVNPAPSRIRMDDLFVRFIADAEARNLSGTTLYGYRAIWKRCAAIAAIDAHRLRPVDLSDLYAHLSRAGGQDGDPLSTRSVGHTHTLLKTILRWAMRLEIVTRNVADAIEPPRGPRKRAKPYNHGDADRLISAAAPTRHGPLVIVAFATGLRRGELAGLRWSDVDLDRRVATIRGAVAQVPGKTWYKPTKTDLVATIALSDLAVDALRSRRATQAAEKLRAGEFYVDEDFVFAPEGGGRPTPGSLSQAIRRIAEGEGLTLRGVHAMRHSTGSWLIRSGVDIRTVAAVLRHSAPSTTLNVYAHEIEGAQAEAVAHLDQHLRGVNGNRLATAASEKSKSPDFTRRFAGDNGDVDGARTHDLRRDRAAL